MKKAFIGLLLLSRCIFSQELLNDISFEKKYFLLLNDLANANTDGYKSHLLDINVFEKRMGKDINFSQGALKFTNRELDFAIIGNAFFKIILKNGNIAYTRNGEFTIDKETNEIITIDGYKLFDSIKIKPGFIKLIINNEHLVITQYENEEEVRNGYLNIYEIDTEKLEYPDYHMSIQNTFLYYGDSEMMSSDKIHNKTVECSNVSIASTIMEMIAVGRLLESEKIEKEIEKMK